MYIIFLLGYYHCQTGGFCVIHMNIFLTDFHARSFVDVVLGSSIIDTICYNNVKTCLLYNIHFSHHTKNMRLFLVDSPINDIKFKTNK